jgi:hypothetical protein
MKRLWLHRLAGIGAGAALAGTLGVVGIGSAPAGAAISLQVIPTTTVPTGSQSTVNEDQPTALTLTATVNGLDPSETGTVTFDLYGPTTFYFQPPTLTYTVPVGPCLIVLKACTATISVPTSALAVGQWDVDAHYSGDALAKPSLGSFDFNVLPPT